MPDLETYHGWLQHGFVPIAGEKPHAYMAKEGVLAAVYTAEQVRPVGIDALFADGWELHDRRPLLVSKLMGNDAGPAI